MDGIDDMLEDQFDLQEETDSGFASQPGADAGAAVVMKVCVSST
jgi:hypothetical protein